MNMMLKVKLIVQLHSEADPPVIDISLLGLGKFAGSV